MAAVSTLISAMYVATNEYALFVRSTDTVENGGLNGDAYFDFSLNNNGDLLELRCGDIVVDEVAYGPEFPNGEGASLSLDPSAYDAESNDAPSAWCLGTEAYLMDPLNLGTPGLANSPCE